MESKVLIFIATYNEISNIEKLCNSIVNISEKYNLLIIDDNSTDGTKEKLKSIEKNKSKVSIINRPYKLGLGSAHRAAMIYATKKKYDYLITMDADFSHDPKVIPKILKQLNYNDFVIGSRYALGGKCDYVGYRKWVSFIGNKLAKYLLRLPINEFTTSFRGFRLKIFSKVNLSEIKSDGYSYFLETVFNLHKSNINLKEVPIHFKDRKRGKSKIPKKEVFLSILMLNKLIIKKYLYIFNFDKPLLNPMHIKKVCYNCKGDCVVEINQIYLKKIYMFVAKKYNKEKKFKCLICGLNLK